MMKKQHKRLIPLLLAVAIALVCTSCGAANYANDSMNVSGAIVENGKTDGNFSYDESSSGANFGTLAPTAPGAGGAVSSGSGNHLAVKDTNTAAPVDSERKIVKTVSINAETKAFEDALALIEQLVGETGGYIEESSRSGGSLHNSSIVERYASYTLRIPADRLDEFRTGIGGSINITNESSRIDDITDSYYDVDARLSSLKMQEERLLAMLEDATELQYMISLEQRLADVRYEIESYTGTIRRYDGQVAYSTVQLSLSEVLEYTSVAPAPKTFGERISIAFRDSWSDFAEGCRNFAVGLVYAAPTLLVLAVIAAAIVGITVGLVRRSRNRRNKS